MDENTQGRKSGLASESRDEKHNSLFKLEPTINSTDKRKTSVIATPKTNIEKIVETLQEISDEFDSLCKSDFKNKAQWILKEILSNKMFKFEENEETTKEQNMLYQLYSTDFEDNAFNQYDESENNLTNNITTIKMSGPSRQSSSQQFQALKLNQLGVYFDVFDYALKNGRENLLRQVFYVSFSYKNLLSLLTQPNLDRFIEELRKGYTSQPDAFYHNVNAYSLTILGLSCCRRASRSC